MGSWPRFIALFPDIMKMLLSGAVMTVVVTAGGFVVSVLLGLIFAGLRTSESRILRAIAHVYVEVFRAVPVLTQLFILYFGLASVGIRLSPIPAAVLGFGLNGGAYLTEVFRAGIEAINRGQTEAALAIGMTRLAAVRLIVMPQALRIVLPALANFSIGLLKDTSLASAVAAPEISFNAGMLVRQTYLSTQIYCCVALVYLALSLPLAGLTRALERRVARSKRA
jgi:His/Glu/Gln/Arg/opine family amino acid ABC transporter permease subunit